MDLKKKQIPKISRPAFSCGLKALGNRPFCYTWNIHSKKREEDLPHHRNWTIFSRHFQFKKIVQAEQIPSSNWDKELEVGTLVFKPCKCPDNCCRYLRSSSPPRNSSKVGVNYVFLVFQLSNETLPHIFLSNIPSELKLYRQPEGFQVQFNRCGGISFQHS